MSPGSLLRPGCEGARQSGGRAEPPARRPAAPAGRTAWRTSRRTAWSRRPSWTRRRPPCAPCRRGGGRGGPRGAQQWRLRRRGGLRAAPADCAGLPPEALALAELRPDLAKTGAALGRAVRVWLLGRGGPGRGRGGEWGPFGGRRRPAEADSGGRRMRRRMGGGAGRHGGLPRTPVPRRAGNPRLCSVLRVFCWKRCDARLAHLSFLAAAVVWYAVVFCQGGVLAGPKSAPCGRKGVISLSLSLSLTSLATF